MNQNLTEQRTEAASGGGGIEPGELLCAVEADRRRVGLEILIRAAVSVLAILLASDAAPAVRMSTIIVLICVTVWPVRHMGDRMELRQNGIVCRGKFYPVGQRTKVTWVGTRLNFLPSTLLQLSGCKKRIDVSYMKDAEKLFARSYSNTI